MASDSSLTFKLLKVKKSKNKNKRYDAFYHIGDNKVRKTSFGSSKYQNYTIHKDKKRRDNYRKRHKNDNIHDPTSPGALSWYLLWGDSTSLRENIKNYESNF